MTPPGFEDGAGLAGQFVWRVLCGLRLAPRGSRAMWAVEEIADRGDRWLRLEAASSFPTSRVIRNTGRADGP